MTAWPEGLRQHKLFWFVSALLLYFALTLAALYWYPDDVEQMNWADREVFNAKIISQYSVNSAISQQKVLDRLGSPDITNALQQNSDIYQLLYYRTHRKTADGITTADECTALLFKNRILIGIGNEAVTDYQTLSQHGGQ